MFDLKLSGGDPPIVELLYDSVGLIKKSVWELLLLVVGPEKDVLRLLADFKNSYRN